MGDKSVTYIKDGQHIENLSDAMTNNHWMSPEEIIKREEEMEFLNQLKKEMLPGMIKSKWALEYKLKMDKAIEDALEVKQKDVEKVKTKGRFQIRANTNGGNWMKDRDWQYKANPMIKEVEDKRESFDIELLIKRKKQKEIQYMALSQ